MRNDNSPQVRAANNHDEIPNVMHENQAVLSSDAASVLKNTYMLLGITIAFSALVAYLAMDMPRPGIIVTLVGFYGLFFLTAKLRNSAWGLVSTFALTGFMGYTLGPIINHYLGMANGAEVISSAFAMTALVFFGLSAYVLTTRKDIDRKS